MPEMFRILPVTVVAITLAFTSLLANSAAAVAVGLTDQQCITTIYDYDPPNNGGPGSSGGTGTR